MSITDNIFKSFGFENEQDYLERGMSTTDAIRKGICEFNDEIQKAVYADTAENRKLGRVGQEYHKGRKKTEGMEEPEGGKKVSSGGNKIGLNEHVKNVQGIFDKFDKDVEENDEDEEAASRKLSRNITKYMKEHNLSHHDFNEIMSSNRDLSNYAVRRKSGGKTVFGEDALDVHRNHVAANHYNQGKHRFK